MKEELNDDGYKKSKLSLEDLSDPKYEVHRQARSEALKAHHQSGEADRWKYKAAEAASNP